MYTVLMLTEPHEMIDLWH